MPSQQQLDEIRKRVTALADQNEAGGGGYTPGFSRQQWIEGGIKAQTEALPPEQAPATPGPAVQALQRAQADPNVIEGWQSTSTPGQTRPGLGDRLPANRPQLFTGRIY